MALRAGCTSVWRRRVGGGCSRIERILTRPPHIAHAAVARCLTAPPLMPPPPLLPATVTVTTTPTIGSQMAAAAAVAVAAVAAVASATVSCSGSKAERAPADGDVPAHLTDYEKYVKHAKTRGLGTRTQYTARVRADSVKDRIVAKYEDKMRLYASPSKTFRYFATVSIEGTVYMRPQDFIRSITPGELQPEGLALDEYDEYFHTDCMIGETDYTQPLLDYKQDGTLRESLALISYAEYRFLCTLLTAPDHYLKVAFRLLDRDGSGDIELREFFSMTELLGSQTRQRQLAMNTNLWATAGSTEFAGVLKHSHLLKQLFGPKGDKRVTFEQFRSFAIALQRKVLHIEFLHNRQLRHPDARDDKMNELTFAKLFLKQSQLPRAMRAEYYTRIQEVFGDSEERTISFDDVYLLFTFLQDTEMVEMALNSTLHLRDDNRLRQDDLQHISQAVCGQKISPELSYAIFVMFDLNKETSNRDAVDMFIKVARNARAHGVTVDNSTSARGFSNLAKSLASLLTKSDKDGDGHMG